METDTLKTLLRKFYTATRARGGKVKRTLIRTDVYTVMDVEWPSGVVSRMLVTLSVRCAPRDWDIKDVNHRMFVPGRDFNVLDRTFKHGKWSKIVPGKDLALLANAAVWAAYSASPRLSVGAVISSTDGRKVLAVGYNGDERGGINRPLNDAPGCDGFIHAEENALLKLRSSESAHMYLTHSPCEACAKRIVNAMSITDVFFVVPYRDLYGIGLLESRGIRVHQVRRGMLDGTALLAALTPPAWHS